MSKKVSKDANKAKVKTVNDKRGVIILCLIAFIVILVIAAVILAFIYLGTVKKSNPDKLSSDVANEIRQDEYVVNGDQEIFEELSAAVRNNYIYALNDNNVYDKMYPYWDNFLISSNKFSYSNEDFKTYYEALQSVYHTKDSDPQHIDIIFKPVSYEACGPYYLFYCTIEYSYLSKEGISKSSGNLEYCFTMRKLGTIDNNGNNLGEQWRFLDFNIQDIGALYTRFTPVSDEKTGNQLSPGLYEATTKANKED